MLYIWFAFFFNLQIESDKCNRPERNDNYFEKM